VLGEPETDRGAVQRVLGEQIDQLEWCWRGQQGEKELQHASSREQFVFANIRELVVAAKKAAAADKRKYHKRPPEEMTIIIAFTE